MADSGLGLLDDTPQATPLDLLINAISGSPYHFSGADDASGPGEEGGAPPPDSIAAYLGAGGGEEHAMDDVEQVHETPVHDVHDVPDVSAVDVPPNEEPLSRKRSAEDDAGSPPLNKIARSLGTQFTPAPPGLGGAFSSVEVWHPKTGQKSYGKERRILQPPPTLRVTGPLAQLLSDVTLSALLNPDPATGPVLFSSQTHHIAGPGEAVPDVPPVEDNLGGRGRKAEREEKKRRLREAAAKTGWGSTLPWERNKTAPRAPEELADGLTFPGLWVGEDTGKSKEFRLELVLGQPRHETAPATVPPPAATFPEEPTTLVDAPSQPLDEAALQRVLGAAEMGPLMLEESDQHQAIKLVEAAALEHIQPEATDPPAEAPLEAPAEPPAEPKPWARFVSDPLTIVSKPSQKTAKARSMASCLSSNDAFSLVVRVNAQTVRTKFMKLDMVNDAPILGARAGKWSPFRFEVLERASPPETEGDKGQRTRFKADLDREKGIVTYGSIVQLVDIKHGSRSDPFRLVRVDKNEVVVGADHGHPVSELQRIGLVRVVDGKDDMEGGGRWYLSAPGAVAGAGEVKTTRVRPAKAKDATQTPVPEPVAPVVAEVVPSEPVHTEEVPPLFEEPPAQPAPATLSSLEIDPAEAPIDTRPAKKRKTKRHALARAAITEEQEGSTAAGLVWHRAQQREGEYTVTEGKVVTTRQATIETVDDWMCWVLSGVWCFSYSFFNAAGDDADALPKAPLDKVPRLLINPNLRLNDNAVDLTLSTFFAPDPQTGALEPFSVYLGPIGPLRATTWRSAAPKEKYYDPGALYPAYPYSGTLEEAEARPDERRVLSNFPYSVPHVIASVELPSMAEIVRTMEQHTPPEPEPQPEPEPEPEPPTEDPGWLGVMGPTTELTIQEAIRNAGKTHAPEHDVAAVLQASVGKDDFEMSNLINPSFDASDATAQPPAHFEAPPPPATFDAAPEGQAPEAPAPAETATTIVMHTPERPKEVLAPLPLLLVRPDGVGHGIGWSIVASPGRDTEQGDVGLQIVQTCAHGRPLGW